MKYFANLWPLIPKCNWHIYERVSIKLEIIWAVYWFFRVPHNKRKSGTLIESLCVCLFLGLSVRLSMPFEFEGRKLLLIRSKRCTLYLSNLIIEDCMSDFHSKENICIHFLTLVTKHSAALSQHSVSIFRFNCRHDGGSFDSYSGEWIIYIPSPDNKTKYDIYIRHTIPPCLKICALERSVLTLGSLSFAEKSIKLH